MVSEILSQVISAVGGWQLPGNGKETGAQAVQSCRNKRGILQQGGEKCSRYQCDLLGFFLKKFSLAFNSGCHCRTNESEEGCIPDLGSQGRKLIQELFGSELLSISTMQAVLSLP